MFFLIFPRAMFARNYRFNSVITHRFNKIVYHWVPFPANGTERRSIRAAILEADTPEGDTIHDSIFKNTNRQIEHARFFERVFFKLGASFPVITGRDLTTVTLDSCD